MNRRFCFETNSCPPHGPKSRTLTPVALSPCKIVDNIHRSARNTSPWKVQMIQTGLLHLTCHWSDRQGRGSSRLHQWRYPRVQQTVCGWAMALSMSSEMSYIIMYNHDLFSLLRLNNIVNIPFSIFSSGEYVFNVHACFKNNTIHKYDRMCGFII